MNDNLKASILGTIFSVVGSLSFLELAQEFAFANVFWSRRCLRWLLFNILVKYKNVKYGKQD